MEQVRIGVIGIGGMGSNHCGQIADKKVPGLVLTAVADIRECRRDWAREALPEGVHVYESAEALMDSGDVDAILVATPITFIRRLPSPDLREVCMSSVKNRQACIRSRSGR